MSSWEEVFKGRFLRMERMVRGVRGRMVPLDEGQLAGRERKREGREEGLTWTRCLDFRRGLCWMSWRKVKSRGRFCQRF